MGNLLGLRLYTSKEGGGKAAEALHETLVKLQEDCPEEGKLNQLSSPPNRAVDPILCPEKFCLRSLSHIS